MAFGPFDEFVGSERGFQSGVILLDNQDLIVQPPRGNWKLGAYGAVDPQFYAFAIINTGTGTPIEDTSLDPAKRTRYAEFIFRVPPRQLDMQEPAAMQILPTQGGGKFVEHQGQIFKDITLVGTTGLRPRKVPLHNTVLGVKVPSTPLNDNRNNETGLHKEEATGFDDLIFLRNLFRRYWLLKTDDSTAASHVLLWRNSKERDYFVVEPSTFTTQRVSQSPLAFNYNIQLRTLGRFVMKKEPDVVTIREDPSGLAKFLGKMDKLNQSLRHGFRFLNSVADRAISVGLDVATTVVSPGVTITNAMGDFLRTGARALSVPRTFAAHLRDTIIQLNQDIAVLENAMSQNSPSDIANAYTNGLTPPAITSGVWGDRSFQMMKAQTRRILRGLNTVVATSRLFESPRSTQVADKVRWQRDLITGQPATAGSQTNLANIQISESVAEDEVHQGENIYRLSQRLLGSADRWKALVLVNRLRAPYIAATASTGVLAPGSKVLYPSVASRGSGQVDPRTANDTSGTSELEKALGRDLLLENAYDAGGGGHVSLDVQTSPGGDMATVVGKRNMEQALFIKFETEPGDLAAHISFGGRYPIGTKASAQSFFAQDLLVRATLLSDTRVQEILELTYGLEGNVRRTRGRVQIAHIRKELGFDSATAAR